MPVTYASLKNSDIDVFLGNWMPTMEADIAPYHEGRGRGRGRQSRRRQVHARGAEVSERGGLKDFADIAKFRTSSTARSTASSPATTATG